MNILIFKSEYRVPFQIDMSFLLFRDAFRDRKF